MSTPGLLVQPVKELEAKSPNSADWSAVTAVPAWSPNWRSCATRRTSA